MTDETNHASEPDDTNTAIPQYPLANDTNGEPLDVPADAVAWRVRKLARKAGRPKLIFDSETGRPMELSLTVTFDDFCEHVAESGAIGSKPSMGKDARFPVVSQSPRSRLMTMTTQARRGRNRTRRS